MPRWLHLGNDTRVMMSRCPGDDSQGRISWDSPLAVVPAVVAAAPVVVACGGGASCGGGGD